MTEHFKKLALSPHLLILSMHFTDNTFPKQTKNTKNWEKAKKNKVLLIYL